jgi:hypothetical protein
VLKLDGLDLFEAIEEGGLAPAPALSSRSAREFAIRIESVRRKYAGTHQHEERCHNLNHHFDSSDTRPGKAVLRNSL